VQYYGVVTNDFPGGLFEYARMVSLFDERPFEHEFFLLWTAQDQYFRGSNKVGNGTIFLSFFILSTVDSNQKSGPKKFSVFSIKLFSAKSV
jgi:hypothetical protein